MLFMFQLTSFKPLVEGYLLVSETEVLFLFSWKRFESILIFLVKLFIKEGIRKGEKFTFWADPRKICVCWSFIMCLWYVCTFVLNPHVTTVTLNCSVIIEYSKAQLCNANNTISDIQIRSTQTFVSKLTKRCMEIFPTIFTFYRRADILPSFYRDYTETKNQVLIQYQQCYKISFLYFKSCYQVNSYAHSCLMPLPSGAKSVCMQWNSRAVWTHFLISVTHVRGRLISNVNKMDADMVFFKFAVLFPTRGQKNIERLSCIRYLKQKWKQCRLYGSICGLGVSTSSPGPSEC